MTFEIVDEGRGPVLMIRESHFGNCVQTSKFSVRHDSLRRMLKKLHKASKSKFSDDSGTALYHTDE